MELREWTIVAKAVRQQMGHPRSQAQAEQEQLVADSEWRLLHPYFYHSYGPKTRATVASPSSAPSAAVSAPSPASSAAPASVPAPPTAASPPFTASSTTASSTTASSAIAPLDDVPATVLAPADDHIRDFNGARAVIARLPRLGEAPTDLTEHGKEVRGSFAVRVFHAFGQPEVEVTRMPSGPVGPFVCDYRGYRKLTGDFAGNVVQTGFHKEYRSVSGRILTGMEVSPSGDPTVFDVATCRDQYTGEV